MDEYLQADQCMKILCDECGIRALTRGAGRPSMEVDI